MIKEQLLSKNGTATLKLSRELLKYSVGEKIPTITDFSKQFNLARGTIQNAQRNLIDSKAIAIESKGHMGSYLVKKNNTILLEFAGITYIVGAMPLPYSKRYEGLASGIIISSENKNSIPINLAYMRGAKNRMSMVENGRYDFAIVSRFAAEKIETNSSLEIVMSFGKNSYTGNHVLMFHNKKDSKIKDGMKVGIDESSYDQYELSKLVCKGKKVKYVPIEYSRMIECVQNGVIDATVMNVDEVLDKNADIHYVEIEYYDNDNTEAVIVADKNRKELRYILDEIIDEKTVLNIQQLVLTDKIITRY